LPYLLGLAYEREGRVDDAIEAYVRMASGLKTVSAKPHENLAALYQKRYGDLDGLEEMIESARLKARHKEYVEGRWLVDKAPQWTLQDTSGKSISLTDFANKIIVQCFVTTQYQSDVEELKYIQGLSDKYKDQGVVFICIDEGYPHPIELRRKKVENAFVRGGITLPIVIDPDGKIAKQYNITESSTLLIDHEGVIRFKNHRFWNDNQANTDQIDYLLKRQKKAHQ
jgi:peroxiredoxin